MLMINQKAEQYDVCPDENSGTSSQRPGEDLLADFRQQFPEISMAGTSSSTGTMQALHPGVDNPGLGPQVQGQSSIVDHSALGHQVSSPVLEGPSTRCSEKTPRRGLGFPRIYHNLHRPPIASQAVFPDQDPTPRASGAEWRFTPVLDSNLSFNNFGTQPPSYYQLAPSGTSALYHSQPSDLHTPALGMPMPLNAPLSMPTSSGAIPAAPMIMNFQAPMGPQFLQTHNPFLQSDAVHHQSSFAPASFLNRDPSYETVDRDGLSISPEVSMECIAPVDATFHGQPQSLIGFQSGRLRVGAAPLPPTVDKFRYYCSLNAPTAMIKTPDEIPVTYLNKGQAYTVSVVDTAATPPAAGTKYRTYIRVSFEDDQQRQKPGTCWSLWKEGRGTNEAHHRGGKLQAVEYIDGGPPNEGDDRKARIELESASFDGFSVTWTPGVHGTAECNISVRFNFLSTDFSHSKGVKGIPVRLCQKTSILSIAGSPPAEPCPEIRYCMVKLFRDHGAERKLANDIAHIKKSIEKQQQNIELAESGAKEFGKRRRAIHGKVQDTQQRAGKVLKHKRTWSASSTGSEGKNGSIPIEEMHLKLHNTKEMFSSTRPVSLFYLPGDDLDDPDLHPVSFPGESPDKSRNAESKDCAHWHVKTARNPVAESALVSPSPSALSLQSQGTGAGQWPDGAGGTATDQVTRVVRANGESWIDVVGADPSYKPPTEHRPKAIACFYITRKKSETPDEQVLYQAVYLTERSLPAFVAQIAAKLNLDPTAVTRVIHVLDRGIEVEVDNDVVQELPEGQDMVLDVSEVALSVTQPKGEWDLVLDTMDEDGGNGAATTTHDGGFFPTTGYELRLLF
ncbi:CP2 transcription factor-domain-containing protein [Xylaria intraflava]|nr:CP2 transcription factor-domain-containing protein [Xylaria intraflava]